MIEKKTYKNPDILAFSDGSGWRITSEGVTEYSDSYKWFRSDEWDMEVAFTKKVPRPQPGGTCTLRGNQDTVYTILAVHEDLAWIRDEWVSSEDTTGWIEPICYLTDVKPWQPA